MCQSGDAFEAWALTYLENDSKNKLFIRSSENNLFRARNIPNSHIIKNDINLYVNTSTINQCEPPPLMEEG